MVEKGLLINCTYLQNASDITTLRTSNVIWQKHSGIDARARVKSSSQKSGPGQGKNYMISFSSPEHGFLQCGRAGHY